MGVMMMPTVASLSEDAMTAVPQDLREGAYALGATRLQVATRVVVPAAISGIVASFVLAISRAIGETMIVLIAAGQQPSLTFDPREQAETMTAFIGATGQGDVPTGSIEYKTIFAVGLTLFVITLVMNIDRDPARPQVPGGLRMTRRARGDRTPVTRARDGPRHRRSTRLPAALASRSASSCSACCSSTSSSTGIG